MRSPLKRGFTLIELLVVIAIIAILASILFPVFAKAREKARQTQCTSNVKQLALAIQMYSQDNGSQYPGIDGSGWVSKIASYLGSSTQMFQCPSDTTGDGVVSYALSGLMVREDGTGVKESQVISPSEVGVLADAGPSQAYPASRVIGGGASMAIADIGSEPATRHSKGLIVGFADGHAKYFQGAINKGDEGNGAVRALYHAAPLGLIDNPTACMPINCEITGSDNVIIGGEYVTRPILMAATGMYAGSYYTNGFKGQKYTAGRPSTGWVWGIGSAGPGLNATSAIAVDGVCVIVAKGCKIPGVNTNPNDNRTLLPWPSMSNSTYIVRTMIIATMFNRGFEQNTVQVYHMPDANCSTNDYIKNVVGNTSWGTDSLEVADDAEMVEKIANDPYGIGYCSTAFADPDRVVVVGLQGMGTDGKDAIWPRTSKKFRWVMPSQAESTWPWKRTLNVAVAGTEAATGVLNIRNAVQTGNLVKLGLYAGPLFTWGYWVGNY